MRTIEEITAELNAIFAAADEGASFSDEQLEEYQNLEVELEKAQKAAAVRVRHAQYNSPAAPAPATAPVAEAEFAEFDDYMRHAQFAQAELTGPTGGYLVPDIFRNKIVEKMLSFGGFASAAENITTASGAPMEWVTVDDTANQGVITPENTAITGGADLVFGNNTLGAYKYTTSGADNLPLKVSWELLQDSAFDIESRLVRWFSRRIARKQAVHWISGDGSGEPLGILTPKTAYDEIASNAAGPTYGELVATVHALDPDYRAGAKWLMNDATLAVLRSQLDNNDRPLWLPSDGSMANALPGGTLLGYPVIIDQAMPSIGDQTKFLAFGDFEMAYVIRRVKGFELVALRELYAPTGQVGYIGWERADGTVQDPNAYVVLAGQNV